MNNCPEEISAEAERLVQVNDHIPGDMFTGAANIVSNLDRKEYVCFLRLFLNEIFQSLFIIM